MENYSIAELNIRLLIMTGVALIYIIHIHLAIESDPLEKPTFIEKIKRIKRILGVNMKDIKEDLILVSLVILGVTLLGTFVIYQFVLYFIQLSIFISIFVSFLTFVGIVSILVIISLVYSRFFQSKETK